MEKNFNHPSGVRLFYHEDNYTDAWRTSPTIVFVHGFAESSEVWRGWVPYFARRYRVVRLDLRGFGRSTPMPEETPVTLAAKKSYWGRAFLDWAQYPITEVKRSGELVIG